MREVLKRGAARVVRRERIGALDAKAAARRDHGRTLEADDARSGTARVPVPVPTPAEARAARRPLPTDPQRRLQSFLIN